MSKIKSQTLPSSDRVVESHVPSLVRTCPPVRYRPASVCVGGCVWVSLTLSNLCCYLDYTWTNLTPSSNLMGLVWGRLYPFCTFEVCHQDWFLVKKREWLQYWFSDSLCNKFLDNISNILPVYSSYIKNLKMNLFFCRPSLNLQSHTDVRKSLLKYFKLKCFTRSFMGMSCGKLFASK